MPFSFKIVDFINETLKAGSLNRKKLQPAVFHGLSTNVVYRKDGTTEWKPGIMTGSSGQILFPTDRQAILVYHKLVSKAYSLHKPSFGDNYEYKCTSDLQLIIYCNSKITGISKFILEPLIIFGLPQRLSPQVQNEMGITNCLISPTGSNFDSIAVFKQEFPGVDYNLHQNINLFQIKYRIETIFSTKCVDACLCDLN